jgi:DNA-binding response OmpR family regulator
MFRNVNNSLSVLLIEDDVRLARFTAAYLQSHSVEVTIVGDGNSAVKTALEIRPDVIVLDLMLPNVNGFDICRELREHLDVPIVVVSARADEDDRVRALEGGDDRVRALEGGADDYVVKPIGPRELLARVRAQVRRARGDLVRGDGPRQIGALSVDPRSMTATLQGRPLVLTSYEFALLRALADRPGRVLSREQLIELVRGSAEQAFDRSVDVHISHLRAKLGDDPRHPRILKTVRGSGYMLSTEIP